MPRDNKYTCAKCGKEKDGNIDQSTAIYMYRGSGKGKKSANEIVCTECTQEVTVGWKFPLDFKS